VQRFISLDERLEDSEPSRIAERPEDIRSRLVHVLVRLEELYTHYDNRCIISVYNFRLKRWKVSV
jgi:hypothetical protein